ARQAVAIQKILALFFEGNVQRDEVGAGENLLQRMQRNSVHMALIEIGIAGDDPHAHGLRQSSGLFLGATEPEDAQELSTHFESLECGAFPLSRFRRSVRGMNPT